MYIYKNKKTKEIVYKEDRELDDKDEWEYITQYKNGRLNNNKIVRKCLK